MRLSGNQQNLRNVRFAVLGMLIAATGGCAAQRVGMGQGGPMPTLTPADVEELHAATQALQGVANVIVENAAGIQSDVRVAANEAVAAGLANLGQIKGLETHGEGPTSWLAIGGIVAVAVVAICVPSPAEWSRWWRRRRRRRSGGHR